MKIFRNRHGNNEGPSPTRRQFSWSESEFVNFTLVRVRSEFDRNKSESDDKFKILVRGTGPSHAGLYQWRRHHLGIGVAKRGENWKLDKKFYS